MNNINVNQTERLLTVLSSIVVNEEEIQSVDMSSVSWELLYEMAKEHRVVSIVYNNMIKLNMLFVDSEVRNLLECSYFKYKKMRETYDIIVDELMQLLNKNKVKVVFLKGYSLNKIVYNNFRDYEDIDIGVEDIYFDKLCDVMLDMGFTSSVLKPKMKKSIAKIIFNNSSEHVFEFIKHIDDMEICFDLHKIIENSSECLDKLYENAIESNGMLIPQIKDCLIFSCYHAWRHYPHPYRMINKDRGMLLKDLMDIREIYLIIKSQNAEIDFYKYANSIGALNVVNEMLYITERIYGEFVSREYKFNFVSNVKHDFYCGEYSSIFENRFFLKEREYIIAQEIKKTYLAMLDNGEKMICVKIDNDNDYDNIWKMFNKICFPTLKNGFWNDFYGCYYSNMNSQEANLGLLWTDNYFICCADVIDPDFHFGKTQYYDELQDAVNLIFIKRNAFNISIQLKYSGEHKVFNDYGNPMLKITVSDSIVKSQINKKGYKVVAMIPWESIDIVPKIGLEFEMYYNVKVGDNKNFGAKNLMPFGKSTFVKLS